MCLAVPWKVLQVGDGRAEVLYGSAPRWIQTLSFPDLAAGEYVTVHAGVALDRIPADAAEEILSFYSELAEVLEAEEA
jgi:hydrogenase assembly chaperone HypC/HupF